MTRITELEYLLLSAIAYGNFDNRDIGLNLWECLFTNEESKNRIFGPTNTVWPFWGRHIFEQTFAPFLNNWKILAIKDETVTYGMDKSWFYAIALQRGDQTMISYRWSDLSSLWAAYKDLIETDLMIGIWGKPVQLEQWVAFYKSFLAAGYMLENISLTWHSLWGWIAQYVALISDKEGFGIPKVSTRNSVGIKKSGILTLVDFVDFDQLITTKYPILLNNVDVYNALKNYYYKELITSLKKQNYIQDKETISMIEQANFKLDLDVSAQIRLENILLTNKDEVNKLDFMNMQATNTPVTKQFLVPVEALFVDLFSSTKLYPELMAAKIFIDAYKKNDKYDEKIINYIHSDDFTSSLYPHMWTTYAVDKWLKTLNEETNPFIKKAEWYTEKNKLGSWVNYILNKAFSLSKSITNHHMVHVFLAFFEFTWTNAWLLRQTLSLDYIASRARNTIYQEKNLSNDFLWYYYSYNFVEMTVENYTTIRDALLAAITLTKTDGNYLNEIILAIKTMNYETFLLLRNKIRSKLSSPYRKIDVHDLMVFYK